MSEQRIHIDNFQGIVNDVNETIISEKSLSECVNFDIDRNLGALVCRGGFGLSTDWDTLPIPSGYELRKIYEFAGADGYMMKLVAFYDTATKTSWRIYYKPGNASPPNYVLIGTYTLAIGEEPFFEGLDGACRIGFGSGLETGLPSTTLINLPIILYYNRITGLFDNQETYLPGWEVSNTIPDISIAASVGKISNVGSVGSVDDIKFSIAIKFKLISFTTPQLLFSKTGGGDYTNWSFNRIDFISTGAGHSYDESTCILTVDISDTSIFGDAIKAAINYTDGDGPNAGTLGTHHHHFNSLYAFDVIGPYDSMDSILFWAQALLSTTVDNPVPLEVTGSAAVSIISVSYMPADTVGTITGTTTGCDNLPIASYRYKITAVFDGQETIPLQTTDEVRTTKTSDRITLKISISNIRDNYFSTRITALNIYQRRTRFDDKDYKDDPDYRFIKQIDLSTDCTDSYTKLYGGTDPNFPFDKWAVTVVDSTHHTAEITFLIHDKNSIPLESIEINLGYRTETDIGIKSYKGSLAYKSRRYIWGIYGSPDRLYYSLITDFPCPDIFPATQFILTPNGEAVTFAIDWEGRLLVFTKSTMYLVDVGSNTPETMSIVDTFTGQGSNYPLTIITTPAGVFYANDESLWLFRGSQPEDLLFGKWRESYTPSTSYYAGYCKRTESIMFSVSVSNIKVYSLRTKTWVTYAYAGGLLRFWNSTSKFYAVTGLAIPVMVEFPITTGTYAYMDYKSVADGHEAYNCYLVTQRLHGDPTLHKMFTKVILNYSLPADTYIQLRYNGICMIASGTESWTVTGGVGILVDKDYKSHKVNLPPILSNDLQLLWTLGTAGSITGACIRSIDVYYEPVDEVRHG